MSTTSGPNDPDERTNANQFDSEGLPGIDGEFPPDRSWGAEDPSVVNTPDGGVAQDNLATRVARENASENDPELEEAAPVLMDLNSGGPAVAGDLRDDEAQALGAAGGADPDAPISAEQAAMRIVEDPGA